ncbi:hypothetical protein LR48_Vigan01g335900 [Vigna angularis]|uniref:Uncharacterized protein n=1 Tax=Phaseolus angularis TaxID=3914 RepID=A0A0L9TT82_PHAAN|nr:hypothetical protein LR48_Vigan01g335900 [Vigna angularis]
MSAGGRPSWPPAAPKNFICCVYCILLRCPPSSTSEVEVFIASFSAALLHPLLKLKCLLPPSPLLSFIHF